MDNFDLASILNRNLTLKTELESARVEIQSLRDQLALKPKEVIKTVEKVVEPVIIYRDKIVESKDQAAMIAKLKHDNAKLIKQLTDAKNNPQSVIIKTIEKQVDNSEKYIKQIDDLKAVITNLTERLNNANN